MQREGCSGHKNALWVECEYVLSLEVMPISTEIPQHTSHSAKHLRLYYHFWHSFHGGETSTGSTCQINVAEFIQK